MLFKNNLFGGNLLGWARNPYLYWSMYFKAVVGQASQIDRRSRSVMVPDYAGASSAINPLDGSLITAAADEHLVVPGWGNLTHGQDKQLCLAPADPGEWALVSGTTRSATGETFGPYTEYNIIDAGSVFSKTYLWSSTYSGSPIGIVYFTVLYNIGTSGEIHFVARNASTAKETRYRGAIGSAVMENQGVAGTIVIISDEYDTEKGYRTLKGSILFNVLSDSLAIGIGPNSSNNSNIKVLGAQVSENRNIIDMPLFMPAAGAVTTYLSRSGLPNFDLSEMPKTVDALNGKADGAIEATGNLVAINRYEIVATETDHFGAGVVAGDRVTGLTTALDANNTVKKISTAQATTYVQFRPGVDAASTPISTVINAIAANNTAEDILHFETDGAGDGFLSCSDGMNTASVVLTWLKSKAYEARIVTGLVGADPKMQLSYREINPLTLSPTTDWLAISAVTDFLGYFPLADEMLLRQAKSSAYGVGLLGVKSKSAITWETPT